MKLFLIYLALVSLVFIWENSFNNKYFEDLSLKAMRKRTLLAYLSLIIIGVIFAVVSIIG